MTYGGYLPLELPPATGEFFFESEAWNVTRLSSGRATFFLAAKQLQAKVVHLPHFTCADTEVPFRKLGIEVKRYFLNDDLLPKAVELKEGEVLLWTNYYGNASVEEISEVVTRYRGSLIIDNCHAFFSPAQVGALNCYSARKFFGVSDGAYLVAEGKPPNYSLPPGRSATSSLHLLKQYDVGTNAGYGDSLLNEARLEVEITAMSPLTQRILSSVDYRRVRGIREENFRLLHALVGHLNLLDIELSSTSHMYYPLMVAQEDLRYRLIEQGIFNPFWWRHVLTEVPGDSIEANLSKYVVLLPIDQRYDHEDMRKIARVVLSQSAVE